MRQRRIAVIAHAARKEQEVVDLGNEGAMLTQTLERLRHEASRLRAELLVLSAAEPAAEQANTLGVSLAHAAISSESSLTETLHFTSSKRGSFDLASIGFTDDMDLLDFDVTVPSQSTEYAAETSG
jgi:hypothetical protein